MCGEKYINGKKWEEIAGSPPRVRGKEGNLKMKTTEQRITPACAGKRRKSKDENNRTEDHPRVCGEKCASSSVSNGGQGSPPRVRGKVDWCKARTVCAGITPACAGKSGLRRGELCALRDHPRVCGEKCASSSVSNGGQGSPPRVRGKGFQVDFWSLSSGITPACAGKSTLIPPSLARFWDHPRVCGEKRTSSQTT